MPGSGGKVYLIGAGPGDPGLMTVRGRECLALAEVVVYDYLANPALLEAVRPEAERLYVGKQAGRHTSSQEEINALLVQLGRAGRVVARLKGGDPFLFGRGGEEAEALVEAGVPFEVVPGVTSAIAVPAYAGIPVTHRSFTSTFAVVTGHEDPMKEEAAVDWEALAHGIGTIVFLMGVGNLPLIAARLQQYGRAGSAPVAVIGWGTRPGQVTVTGTLATIADAVQRAGMRPPAVIVVGEVVALRERLRWFDNRPLWGKRVLVTRTREQASALSARLRVLGAEPLEYPAIRTETPRDWRPVDLAIGRLESYDWVVFTSANGVDRFFERMRQCGRDARAFGSSQIAAIGEATAQALMRIGLSPDLVPAEFVAEGVLEGLVQRGIRGKRILLARAEVAREILPEGLRQAGAEVEVLAVYRTRPDVEAMTAVRSLLERGEVEVVTFTSSSTVQSLAESIDAGAWMRLPVRPLVACIGPITADTARERGFTPDIVAERHDIPGLVEAIVSYLARESAEVPR